MSAIEYTIHAPAGDTERKTRVHLTGRDAHKAICVIRRILDQHDILGHRPALGITVHVVEEGSAYHE